MKKFLTLGFLLMAVCACQSAQEETSITPEQLLEGFQNPPQVARPQVWWHWMDGNITKDGIEKDIDWMHRIGLGGFHTFDAGLATPQIVDKRLIYMTPEWKDAFSFAMQKSDSYGMEVSIASSPGWSCMGGPWVEPKDGMKKLVWRTLRVQGGGDVHVMLPEPFRSSGVIQDDEGGGSDKTFYEDIKVLAVKMPDGDKSLLELGAKVTTSGGEASLEKLTSDAVSQDGAILNFTPQGRPWIQYELPDKMSFRSVSVVDGRARDQWADEAADWSTTLLCSDDGVSFRKVADIPSSTASRSTVTFEETTARFWRLEVDNPEATNPYGSFGALIAGSLGVDLGTTQALTKTVNHFNLYQTARVHHAEEKAGYASPHDLHSFPTPDRVGEVSQTVVDLTDKVDQSGTLNWSDAPAGNWKILRLGYSLTGKQNSPAPKEATGLEVDKLDPDAWSRYFHTYFDMYKDASGGLMGERGIQNILTDSYEAGQENWTHRMAEEFKARRGYDLWEWMPVLTGEIIGSAQKSEQFLFDYRKTLSELVTENYDALTDIAREYGLKGRFSESQENGRVFIVDGMDIKRKATVPMSAIWMPHPLNTGSKLPMSKADIRESASVAHVFGQNLVAAESLTATGFGGQAYSYCPENLKPIVDIEFANGLNRLIVHESAHQPLDEYKPGLSLLIFGQWFNRHDTWAELAGSWVDYIARSSYMLQQGRFQADILYYYGEDSNITAEYGFSLPDTPKGYNFDFINPTALLTLLDYRDGSLTTPSGMRYKVLVLDRNCEMMTVEVLQKIEKLAKKGALIVGKAPLRSASMNDDQKTFDRLVQSIFSSGRKNVLISLDEALRNVPKDYSTDADLSVVHRDLGNIQVYWVSNPTDEQVKTLLGLNVSGLRPQIWDPETGKVRQVGYTILNGKTTVDLKMNPHDAFFIVLTPEKDLKDSLMTEDQPLVDLQALDGAWSVQFPTGTDAPQQAEFDHLMSYTESPVSGIRYFSGTATYTKTFSFEKPQGRVILDLGNVKNLCQVTLNGQNAGLLWRAPFTLDVTDLVKEGENTLEVQVTNLWPNRIIGDLQPGVKEKTTWISAAFYSASSPLLESGLIGPVRLLGK